MSNEKFTPGEWRAEIESHPFCDTGDYVTDFGVVTGENIGIAQCFDNSVINEDEAAANCFLIAAAPEMYRALEDVCSDCEMLSNWEDLFNIGRPDGTKMPPCPCKDCYVEKALKKARGEV